LEKGGVLMSLQSEFLRIQFHGQFSYNKIKKQTFHFYPNVDDSWKAGKF